MKSELMIHTLGQGCETVLETGDHIEAPNWTPDGRALVYNGGGRLFRLDLATRKSEVIWTGKLDKLNNDHGISPDGLQLAISDKTEHGASCIYLLPFGGGTPVQFSPLCPSYWHGWSPDGQTLAYVGLRDGAFDIFTAGVSGGTERRVTRDMGHCDGPDYSPDGDWIWFNSDVSGHAQIWRVRPDGSECTRMTQSDTVDWFPHPAPDGGQVLFLAYPDGTTGHPFGLDVALKLMPATGGPAQTVVELFGGQGTINVPCWSPDSTQFAYMRYAKEAT